MNATDSYLSNAKATATDATATDIKAAALHFLRSKVGCFNTTKTITLDVRAHFGLVPWSSAISLGRVRAALKRLEEAGCVESQTLCGKARWSYVSPTARAKRRDEEYAHKLARAKAKIVAKRLEPFVSATATDDNTIELSVADAQRVFEVLQAATAAAAALDK